MTLGIPKSILHPNLYALSSSGNATHEFNINWMPVPGSHHWKHSTQSRGMFRGVGAYSSDMTSTRSGKRNEKPICGPDTKSSIAQEEVWGDRLPNLKRSGEPEEG